MKRCALSFLVVGLNVTEEPKFDDLSRALELMNGQGCTLLTGATAPVAGLRVNYSRPDGAQVVGGPNRRLARWRVFCQTAARNLSLDRVEGRSVPRSRCWRTPTRR